MSLGNFLLVNFASNDCLHLPKKWKNRISSISSIRCIQLYTQENCLEDKIKGTLLDQNIYIKENSKPISSYNLFGSL